MDCNTLKVACLEGRYSTVIDLLTDCEDIVHFLTSANSELWFLDLREDINCY